jgi:hypothetical protein
VAEVIAESAAEKQEAAEGEHVSVNHPGQLIAVGVDR